MMQFGNLVTGSAGAGQAVSATPYEKDFEDEFISKLYLAIRGDAGTDGPTAAELKAAWVYARLIRDNKETILIDASMHDLAFDTDCNGGYAGSFATGATKWPVVNLSMPLGLDMLKQSGGGHLEVRISFDAAWANTKWWLWSINDGSRPATLRRRTLTTGGTPTWEQLYKLFIRDAGAAQSDIKLGSDKQKTIVHKMGEVALQEWASIEAASIYSQIVNQETPDTVKLIPTASLTCYSIEAPV